jgi:hypothetical protein
MIVLRVDAPEVVEEAYEEKDAVEPRMLSEVVDSAVETVETWEVVRPRGLPDESPAMDSVSDWRGVVGVRPPGPFELGGTSWTWRFRGWLDFAGGGRTNINVFFFWFKVVRSH